MAGTARSTSTDVARRAGVSRATVSYVLNGRTDQSIPESTRRRVLGAAQDLGYVPHAASRALRAGRSHLVLLINSGVPWSTNITEIHDALTADVAATGRSLVVWRRQGVEELAATLANLEPCVAITLDPLSAEEEHLLAGLQIPLVEADLPSGGTFEPARLQAGHLITRGHRRLGYLTTTEPSLQRFADPRTAGFLEECARQGLPSPEVATLPGTSAPEVEAVAAVLNRWRALPDPVTAVACFNDLHAAACLAAAATLGVPVPAGLSVIGLDNDDFAQLTSPALTTIQLQPRAFAAHVWDRALNAMGESARSRPLAMESSLIERASVQALPPHTPTRRTP